MQTGDRGSSMNPSHKLPDFFIIGFPKCGTTDVASLLDQHPRIRICQGKEPAFFDRDDLYRHTRKFVEPWNPIWQMLDWESHIDSLLDEYDRLFDGAPTEVLRGDASTGYCCSHRALDRIRSLAPAAKIIVFLREPVKRFVSHYWYDFNLSFICHSIDSYLWSRQANGPLRLGVYAMHLKPWLSAFSRDQFHIVLFEEYISPSSRQGVVDGICKFLGVEPSLEVAAAKTDSNASRIPRWVSLELLLNWIRLNYRLPSLRDSDSRAQLVYGRKRRLLNSVVQSVSRMNYARGGRSSPWPPELMERLRAYYRRENDDLSELIGRDVNAIWYGADGREQMASPIAAPPLSPALTITC